MISNQLLKKIWKCPKLSMRADIMHPFEKLNSHIVSRQ